MCIRDRDVHFLHCAGGISGYNYFWNGRYVHPQPDFAGTAGAVSYTHLDVYKRQLPACSCTEKCAPGAIHTDCEVCAVNMTECAGTAPEPAPVTEPVEEPEPEPQQKSNTGTLLLILAVAVLGSGAGWYFKIYRPKHEKAAVPEEDYSEELADYDDPEDDGPPWDCLLYTSRCV